MTDESCPFCLIATGQAACHRVFEGAEVVAFLDRRPIRPGHTQIIPRAHYPYFDDIPAPLLAEMTTLGQRLAKVLKDMYGVDRVAFAFTGGDVAHAHAHVVPMVAKDDITSRRYIVEESVTYRGLPQLPDDQQSETARQIAAALRALGPSG